MSERLSSGDLVLVTGAAGLVGGAVADELLKRGFKVRGVTRNKGRETLLQETFDKAYGIGSFEWAEVPDATVEGAYDDALKGVSGIVHAATDASFSASYEQVVDATVAMTLGILNSAQKIGTVKSVVVTSSCVAVYTPPQEKDVFFGLDEWNESAVQLAQQLPADHPGKAFLVYTASKTRAEQELWGFVKSQQPSFAVNTILPFGVVGPTVNTADRVYSSSTWTKDIFLGKTNNNFLWDALLQPFKIIDVRDSAILHVAALLDPQTENARLWAGSHDVTIQDVLSIWQEAYPDHKLPVPDSLRPAAKVTIDSSRSEELLQRYAGRSFLPAKQSYLDNVKGSS